MRQAGKHGRLTPKRAKAIPFSRIFSGTIPAHPLYVDYLAHLGGQWQMLGNDRAGDCVSVTWANERRLVTATLTDHTAYPNQDQVWQLYRTQNPRFNPDDTSGEFGPGSSADNGMEIQTTLEYLHSTGGPDGVKLVAFASVNVKDSAEVMAAIAAFGCVWTGVFVYPNNDQEFSSELPWDWNPQGQAGGHSVLTGGYGTTLGLASPLTGDQKFITWAEETSFTDTYWANGVEEAFVCIWPEHLGSREFETSVNRQQLASVYYEITGSQLVLS